jgi:hypothetical protein
MSQKSRASLKGIRPRKVEKRTIHPKNILMMPAVRASKSAHVLHHPQHLRLRLVEELHTPHRIPQRQVLRRGNPTRAIEQDRLRDRELHVAGTGRQVQDQEVEFGPRDLEEELVHGFLHHEAAPSYGGVLRDEEAHAHGFEAVGG